MKVSTFYGKKNTIGKKLLELRTQYNYSQEELCSKLSLLGVTLYQVDIYRIEHFQRPVKDFELWAFAKIFNISMDELLDIK